MNATNETNRRPLALTALAGATLLASLGISIVTVALPALARDFSAPVPAVQWVVLAYLMSVTVTVVLAGRLGDVLGHRPVLIAGLVLFTAASALCAAAPTFGALIAGRAAQGIGGAVLMAMPVSILRETVAKQRIGSAMGVLGTMSAIGTALGPSLGGLLISGFGWRAAFVVLTGLGVLVLAVTPRAVPTGRTQNGDSRMDWPGAALLAVTLTLYALAASGGKAGMTAVTSLLLPAMALALAAFILVETRSPWPIVPMSIIRNRVTGTALAANILVTTVMMSTLVVGPFFLAFGLGLDETLVGLVMAVGPVTAALTGVLAGRVTDRFGARPVLAAGLIEIAIGLVLLALLPRSAGVAGYSAALIILTPGFQLFLAANSTAAMVAAPDEQRGVLSGLLGLSRNLGFMTGASIMATLFAAAIGPGEIVDASATVVGEAFTTTFLVAAGLTVFALLLAILGRPMQEVEVLH